jgi:hypothetical protein
VSLSDFLLCVEMAIVAVAHTWIFSAKEHQSGEPTSALQSVFACLTRSRLVGFYSLSCTEDASQGVKVRAACLRAQPIRTHTRCWCKVVEMGPHQAVRNMLSIQVPSLHARSRVGDCDSAVRQDFVRDVGAAASHLPTLGSTINSSAAAWLLPESPKHDRASRRVEPAALAVTCVCLRSSSRRTTRSAPIRRK